MRPPIADDWSRLHKSPTETDGRQVYKQLADTPTCFMCQFSQEFSTILKLCTANLKIQINFCIEPINLNATMYHLDVAVETVDPLDAGDLGSVAHQLH